MRAILDQEDITDKNQLEQNGGERTDSAVRSFGLETRMRYKIQSGRLTVQKSFVVENSWDPFIAVLWKFVVKGAAAV